MKRLEYIGISMVLGFFLIFFIVTTFFLERKNPTDNRVDTENNINYENVDYTEEKNIVNNLYKDIKILYDVVNNKFRVDQDEVIVIGDITYKKIVNFDDVMDNLFTLDGQKKYVDDLSSYFAITDNGYYLAGNLVSYQTYYFRGDNTNIYITSASSHEINGIIYEKWTSNNKNTLATIKVVLVNDKWLVDDITLLATE